MKAKHKAKINARNKREAEQARRVVNGIFIGLIAMVVIFTVINIIGLDWLEKLETVFTALVLIAFAAVTVVGFMNWNYNTIDIKEGVKFDG